MAGKEYTMAVDKLQMAIVEIDEKALWLTDAVIDSEKFNRIFRFFVINSPVDGLSSRQISLFDHG